MGFPTAVRTALSRYATFSGRARRSEFWWFILFTLLVVLAAAILDGLAGTDFVFYGIALLALLLPSIAVAVRRLHDTDRSGWWYLLLLVPLAGLVLYVFWAMPGTPHENRYGAPPA